MNMRKTVLALAGAVALGAGTLTTGAAQAVPAGLSNPLNAAAGAIDLVEQAQYYRGRRYCFYLDAWRGPGWYVCGYARRRGYGWGGPSGWLGWHDGPAYRGPVYRYRGPRDYRRDYRREYRPDYGPEERRGRQPVREY